MAKYECKLQGNFNQLLITIEMGILNGSMSASLEESSNYSTKDVKCAVRVYERFSIIGKNRVSMSVVLIGEGDNLFLSAITSGGSQAVFFKINTFGEEAFLTCLTKVIEKYKQTIIKK
ncbi:MAG: hypothetical protein EOM87_04725 [Clostridia bacterium]|nr:hypothetical protein [Clostridia bacterium]